MKKLYVYLALDNTNEKTSAHRQCVDIIEGGSYSDCWDEYFDRYSGPYPYYCEER
jgi:hypothetical protein